MSKKQTQSAGEKLISGLAELHDALSSGVKLREHFTVREIVIAQPQPYGRQRVRRLRDQLGMSQATFAASLGVSTELVRSWEIGKRQVGTLAARLLELVESNPMGFVARVIVTQKSVERSTRSKSLSAKIG